MRAPGRAPCWWAARGSHASRRASWRPTPAGAGRTSTCNNAIAWARCASWQTKPCAAKRRARRTHGTPPANPPTPPAPRPHGPDSPGTGALTAWRPRRAGNRPHPPVAAHAPGRPGTTYTTSPVTPDTDLDLPREDLAPTTKPGTGLAAQPTLRDELAADLDIPVAQLDEHTSLIQLGMDSMHLMAWLNRLRQRGHEVTLRQLYGEPTLAGWSRLLQQKAGGARAPAAAPPAWPVMPDGEAFELPPVQHAYLVGRSPQQTLGGVGCHLYQEFDGTGLSVPALESAVQALIKRHPMLR